MGHVFQVEWSCIMTETNRILLAYSFFLLLLFLSLSDVLHKLHSVVPGEGALVSFFYFVWEWRFAYL